MVDVINVHSAQTLEVVLNPPVESPIPFPFNRLLIFTGIAVVQVPSSGPRDDDNLIRETAVLDLSSTHSGGGGGRRQFNPATTQVVASASPSSMMGTDDASIFTWAVDNVATEFLDDPGQGIHGALLLKVDAASQGDGGLFQGFAYQVFVQTAGMEITDDSGADEINVRTTDTEVAFVFTLFFQRPNPGGPISIFSPDRDLGLPRMINVIQGANSADVNGRILPVDFPLGRTELVIQCETAVSVYKKRSAITVS